MATKATRLPSGNWRVRVQSVSHDGKRHYKSFTAESRKEAEFLAAQYALTQRDACKPSAFTVGAAISAYIDARSAVLSPATVLSYRQMRNRYFQDIENIRLVNLHGEDVQRQVNAVAVDHSPKTVRNVYALLSAALSVYHPDLALRINLPPKTKKEMSIPQKHTISQLLCAAHGTPMENAILLAAAYGLRRGEISALLYADLDQSACTIRVSKSLSKTCDHEWVVKTPKSYAGNRTIRVSENMLSRLLANRHHPDRVCPLTPDAITRRFERLCDSLGVHCRFHDLRHYNASLMLSLSVPDKYAMERLGQSTPGLIKAVYQHIMADKREDVAATVNSAVESFLA